jgi:membrane protein DedA with SNARE-associated domain
VADWVFRIVEQSGYLGVALLMFAETMFPPIPSEVVMPLAGVVAARGHLSLLLVIVAGTVGSMAGNLVWYGLARFFGIEWLRPVIQRYGKWLTIDWTEVERAERMFARRGNTIVLLGRMLPMIRMLISIPAGLLRMKVFPYLVFSTLGSAIWTAALTTAGWVLGHQFQMVETFLGPLSLVVIAGIVVWYIWRVATWRPAA